MARGRARLRQHMDANKRQSKRREAAKELNALSAEVLDTEVHVKTRTVLCSEPRVEQPGIGAEVPDARIGLAPASGG